MGPPRSILASASAISDYRPLPTHIRRLRHHQPHLRPTPRTAHHLHDRALAVEHFHPLAHVPHPNPRALPHQPPRWRINRPPRLHPHAIVFNLHDQTIAVQPAA